MLVPSLIGVMGWHGPAGLAFSVDSAGSMLCTGSPHFHRWGINWKRCQGTSRFSAAFSC